MSRTTFVVMGGVGNKGNLLVSFGTDFTDDTVFLFEPRRRQGREGFWVFPDRGKTDQEKATPWGCGSCFKLCTAVFRPLPSSLFFRVLGFQWKY